MFCYLRVEEIINSTVFVYIFAVYISFCCFSVCILKFIFVCHAGNMKYRPRTFLYTYAIVVVL